MSLLSVVTGTAWLVAGSGASFFVAVVVLFFVQLAALAAVACYTTVGVLLRG
jgi:hypothetical protein